MGKLPPCMQQVVISSILQKNWVVHPSDHPATRQITFPYPLGQGCAKRLLAGELDFPLLVDADALHQHLVALLEDVRNILDPLGIEFGNMNQSVGTREYLHKGAKIH